MARRLGTAVAALLLLTVGCKRDVEGAAGSAVGATTAAPPATTASAPAAPAPAGATSAEGCLLEPDYLLPPTAFGDRDLVRAIVTDESDAYLANMTDILRAPLAGGAPVKVARAPGTTLSGRLVLWHDGTRLLTQSSAEPIFMELPKAGGEWRTFIDLTLGQKGGGRDAATRILQGIGKGTEKYRAGWADFDGATFYFTENPAQRSVAATGRVRSIPLAGGEATTLHEAPGVVDGLLRAGSRLVFIHTEPPDPVLLAQYEAERKAKKYGPEPKGKSSLVSIALTGGDAKRLLGMGQWMSRAVLATDGESVVASGYLEEDLQKPGVYRVDANGGMVHKVDPRVVSGEGVRYAGGVAFAGSGFLRPDELRKTGVVVLALPTGAAQAVQLACFPQRFTTHAVSVTGKTLLVSLFDGETGLASVARLALP